MATIRDPMFWKRFSVALRMDEEAQMAAAQDQKEASSSTRPVLDHTDSWLEREKAKKKRQTWMCWGFWFGFFGFVAGVVVLIIFLENSGVFKKLGRMSSPYPDDDS